MPKHLVFNSQIIIYNLSNYPKVPSHIQTFAMNTSLGSNPQKFVFPFLMSQNWCLPSLRNQVSQKLIIKAFELKKLLKLSNNFHL